MGPLANGAQCLSTPKHNGKSGTSAWSRQTEDYINCYSLFYARCQAYNDKE